MIGQKYLLGQWVRIMGRTDRGLIGAYQPTLGYFVLGRWWPSWLVVAE